MARTGVARGATEGVAREESAGPFEGTGSSADGPAGKAVGGPPGGRPADEALAVACEEARWALCRLAVGASLDRGARELARHVADCRGCDDFVDDLAEGRRFLLADPRPDPGDAELARRAGEALGRELAARLARDLLATVQGDPLRPLAERRRDLARCAVLGSALPWEPTLRARIERAVLEPQAVDRRALLELACDLDRQGLDVALAWMGHLVRCGQDDRAQLVADRVLSGWPV